MLPVVILCGGISTRLQPLTAHKPKSLIDVIGKPFIDHQLNLLKENHVQNVILCIGKYGEQIRDYVGTGEKWGVSVKYSDDGKLLLGTGGALLHAYDILPHEFILINGDSYLDFDYNKAVKRYYDYKLPMLITIFPVTISATGYGNIRLHHGKIVEYNKSGNYMDYIDYGFTIMQKNIIDNYKKSNSFDLSIIYSDMINKKLVSCYLPPKVFHEIGSFEGLELTKKYIRGKL